MADIITSLTSSTGQKSSRIYDYCKRRQIFLLAFALGICLSFRGCLGVMSSETKVCPMKQIVIESVLGWYVDCSDRDFTIIPRLPSNTLILDMSFNNLKTINNFELKFFTYLVELNLSHNNISQLVVGCFKGMQHLEILDLSSNNLHMTNVTYYQGLFDDSIPLKKLQLHDNIQSSDDQYQYPGEALGKARSLEFLSIDGLTNKSFGQQFHNLRNLSTLVISGVNGYCYMRFVGENFFKYLTHLTNVTLFKCAISTIHESAMVPLNKLEYLDLGQNTELGFDRMAHGLAAMNNTNTLKHISLNNIYNELEIGVRIDKVHLCWMQNLSLQYLDIGNSAIETFVPDVLTSCVPKTLRVIKIANSRLIYGDLFVMEFRNFPVLEYIDARNSAQRRGKISIQVPIGMDNLHTIILSDNMFVNWYKATYLKTLVHLDLSHNSCEMVDDDFFDDSAKIEYLDISRNYLGVILDRKENSDIFRGLLSLKYLSLARNAIRSLPIDLLKHQDNLEYLLLDNNSLDEFNLKISHMQKLKSIGLGYNRIASMSKDVTQSLDQIGRNLTVDITGNILYCSCDYKYYIEWLISPGVKIRHDDDYTCYTDNGTESYKTLEEIIDKLDKDCQDFTGLIMISGSMIFAFSIAICVVMIYNHKWKLSYFFYLSRAKYIGHNHIQMPKHIYDALVIYAEEDLHFVQNEIVPKLETFRGSKLCIPDRDFVAGSYIADAILQAIHNSRFTIILLSGNFVCDQWCRYAFNMAQIESIHTDRDVVIVVDYSTVPNDLIPPEIQEARFINTTLTYGGNRDNQEFWDSLFSVLKHDRQANNVHSFIPSMTGARDIGNHFLQS